MAEQITISGKDTISQVFKSISNAATSMGKTVKSQLTGIADQFKKIGQTAQELTAPLKASSGLMVRVGSDMVSAAYQAELGATLFQNVLRRNNQNIAEVDQQLEQLSEQLKIPTDIIKRNATELIRSGYSWEQVQQIYTGAAASGMLVGKTTSQSIEKVTEALITQMSTYSNQIGIVLNLNTAYSEYAKSVGKTVESLTAEEKAAIATLMITRSTADEVKDLPKLFEGYGGALADASKEAYEAKKAFGNELLPVWTQFYRTTADVLHTFNTMAEPQKNFIINIGKIAVGAVTAAAGLALLSTGIGVVAKGFGLLWAITSLIPTLLGVAALVGAGYLIYEAWNQDWGGIKSAITDFADSALEKFEGLKKWWDDSHLKKSLEKGLAELKAIWTNSDLTFSEKVIDTLEIGVGVLKAIAVDAIEIAKDVVVPALEFAVDKLKPMAANIIDFTAINAELFQSGLNVIVGLQIAKGATQKILGSVASAFAGFSKGVSAIGGGNLAIATISVAVALAEAAQGEGWEKFGANMIAAIAAGIGIGMFTGSPHVGALAFTVVLNFKVGSWISDNIFKPMAETIFGPKNRSKINTEYANAMTNPSYTWENFLEFLGNNTPPYFHDGGFLPGVSGPDQYLAMLAPGEAVVPAKAVRGGWAGVLEWFRSQGVPGFKDGYAPDIPGFGSTKDLLSGINEMFDRIKIGFQEFFILLSDHIMKLVEKYAPDQAEWIRDIVNTIKEFFKPSEKEDDESIPDDYHPGGFGFVFKDPSPSKWTTIIKQVKDLFKNITAGVGQQIYANAPVANAAVDGAKQGAAGGPVGMIGGALVGMITQSETFSTLMANINPILQATADAVGMLLEPLLPIVNIVSTILAPILDTIGVILSSLLAPAFQLLFPIIKFFGVFIMNVAKIGAVIWNGFATAVNNVLGWLGIHIGTIDVSGFDDALKTLTDTTYDSALAQAENTEEIKKNTQELYNVPDGFKINLRQYQATTGVDLGKSTVNNPTVNNRFDITIKGDIVGIDNLKSTVETVFDEVQKRRGIQSTGVPSYGF